MASTRTSIELGTITAGNMLLWFLFQGVILVDQGASHEADAFFASLALPQLLMAIANGSLMHVLVPFFSTEDHDKVPQRVYALLAAMLLLFIPIALLLCVSAGWWVPWFVPGFSDEATALTVSLARIQVLGLVFTASTAVVIAACHGRRQFTRGESAPGIATLLACLALVPVYPAHGVAGAAWLMAARPFFIVALLLPNFGRPPRPDFSGIQSVWHQIKPLLLSASYYRSDQLFDRFLSSLGRVGDLSTLYFAQQIHVAGNSVLAKALCAPIVPALAGHAKSGTWNEFTALYRRGLARVVIVALICYGIAVLLHVPLLRLMMLIHPRAPATMDRLYWLLVLLGGVLVGGLAGLVLAEAFFSMGNTRTPAVVLVTTFTAGMIMKAAGFYIAGIDGLAIATTLFYSTSPLTLLFLLERDLKKKRSGHGRHSRDGQSADASSRPPEDT